MSGKFKISQDIFIRALENLASEARQRYTWFPNAEGDMSSFVEDVNVNNVFDDALVTDALKNNQVIYDQKVTAALRHGSKPRYETIAAVLRALNFRIAVAVK